MAVSSIQKKTLLSSVLVFGVLIADQALKLWVHSAFRPGEEYRIVSWFRLLYVENEGMAFGMVLGDKIWLSIFRVVASVAILLYLMYCVRKDDTTLRIACIALIFAGAFGNVIDCMFYGIAFGYAPFLYGKVIDMLYFPLIEGYFWQWIPIVGGESFVFFSPVFNLADAAICIGVGLWLILEKKTV